MKKILFLSTLNLAGNPRLVKEMRLALQNKYQVEIICFEFDGWSKTLNEQLKFEFSNEGVIINTIAAGKEPFFNWFKSVCLEKVARFFCRYFKSNTKLLGSAVSRRNFLLIQNLHKIQAPDLVIGHNPGALYPTLYAAQKFNCRAGFDVEDYHPGEGKDKALQQITRMLMQQVLPKMNYLSFASPLIREAVAKDLGAEANNWITVLNYFPSVEFAPPSIKEGPLKLVWFSQNISFNRGLEQLIPVVKNNPDVELQLFGNCDEDFKRQWLLETNNILLHSSLPQEQLHQQLANFDIGLALEPGKDLNNELAISNKMLAYFQSGLYLLATNTKAQSWFINEHAAHGTVTNLQPGELASAIQKLIDAKQQIRATAAKRFENVQHFNWEMESQNLFAVAWSPDQPRMEEEDRTGRSETTPG